MGGLRNARGRPSASSQPLPYHHPHPPPAHTQGSCTPELGSPTDDYWQLPFARELEDVFEVRVVVVAW